MHNTPPLTREEFRTALHAYNDNGVEAVRQYLNEIRSTTTEQKPEVPPVQAEKAVVRTVTHDMKKLDDKDLMKYGIDEDIQKFLAVKLKMEYTKATGTVTNA